MQRLGANATTHGTRASFRMWAADQGIAFEVPSNASLIRSGIQVVAAYQRSPMLERRRPVMAEWGPTSCRSLMPRWCRCAVARAPLARGRPNDQGRHHPSCIRRDCRHAPARVCWLRERDQRAWRTPDLARPRRRHSSPGHARPRRQLQRCHFAGGGGKARILKPPTQRPRASAMKPANDLLRELGGRPQTPRTNLSR